MHEPHPTDVLSGREREILALIAQGHSNEEICDLLHVSINTVKTHIRSLYKRIGVDRRSQAIVWAHRHDAVG